MEQPFDRRYDAILEIVHPSAGSRFGDVQSPDLAELRAYADANLKRLVSLLLLPALAAKLGGHEQVLARVAATNASIPDGAIYTSPEQQRALFDELKRLREMV